VLIPGGQVAVHPGELSVESHSFVGQMLAVCLTLEMKGGEG